jgi:membrane protein
LVPAVDLTSAEGQRPAPAATGTGGGGAARWLAVAKVVQARLKADNGVLLAAGVAFFGLLALFPALIAVVSIYGLVADPADVQRQVASLTEQLPEQTQELLTDQLDGIVAASTAGLSLTAGIAVLAALWTTSSGVGHLLEAVRRAYGVPVEASLVRGRLRAVAYAVVGALVAVVVVALLAVVPALARAHVPGVVETVLLWLRWPFLAVVMVVVLAQVYRHGSAHRGGVARWLTPGSVLAVVAWLVASAGFALYVGWFGSFDATYGSLGGVIVTMLWLYLSSLCILVGAYVNAELERGDEVVAAAT